jgi:DNA-binding IclR family transcriptional regulator
MLATNNATPVDCLRLIRAEYLEVPGLQLTKAQVQRMWGIDRETCDALLAALVESRFLRRTESDRYARVSSA